MEIKLLNRDVCVPKILGGRGVFIPKILGEGGGVITPRILIKQLKIVRTS